MRWQRKARINALRSSAGLVVPFHRLPNPVDDMDDEVESDNPYATLDSNYFVPEWPVGRMPGEAGPDAGLLLQQLRQSIQYHKKLVPNKRLPVLGGVFSAVGTLVKSVTRSRKVTATVTASVWQKTSLRRSSPWAIRNPCSVTAGKLGHLQSQENDHLDGELL